MCLLPALREVSLCLLPKVPCTPVPVCVHPVRLQSVQVLQDVQVAPMRMPEGLWFRGHDWHA